MAKKRGFIGVINILHDPKYLYKPGVRQGFNINRSSNGGGVVGGVAGSSGANNRNGSSCRDKQQPRHGSTKPIRYCPKKEQDQLLEFSILWESRQGTAK